MMDETNYTLFFALYSVVPLTVTGIIVVLLSVILGTCLYLHQRRWGSRNVSTGLK